MKKNDGGPAFPRAGFDGPDMYDSGWDGMTLRDWFAGQALAGLLAGRRYEKDQYPPQLFAHFAYMEADAMLAERDK